MVDDKTPPEGDPWLGSENATHTKTIGGKEVVFRSKPLTKHFKNLIKNMPKDADSQNYELVRAVVISPEISQEYWENLNVSIKGEIMSEVMRIIGVVPSFPVRE